MSGRSRAEPSSSSRSSRTKVEWAKGRVKYLSKSSLAVGCGEWVREGATGSVGVAKTLTY